MGTWYNTKYAKRQSLQCWGVTQNSLQRRENTNPLSIRAHRSKGKEKPWKSLRKHQVLNLVLSQQISSTRQMISWMTCVIHKCVTMNPKQWNCSQFQLLGINAIFYPYSHNRTHFHNSTFLNMKGLKYKVEPYLLLNSFPLLQFSSQIFIFNKNSLQLYRKTFHHFKFHNSAFYFRKQWLITCFVPVGNAKMSKLRKLSWRAQEKGQMHKWFTIILFNKADKDMCKIAHEHRWSWVTIPKSYHWYVVEEGIKYMTSDSNLECFLLHQDYFLISTTLLTLHQVCFQLFKNHPI